MRLSCAFLSCLAFSIFLLCQNVFAETTLTKILVNELGRSRFQNASCEEGKSCRIYLSGTGSQKPRSLQAEILFGEQLISISEAEAGVDQLLRLTPRGFSKIFDIQAPRNMNFREITLGQAAQQRAFLSSSGEVYLHKQGGAPELLTIVSPRSFLEADLRALARTHEGLHEFSASAIGDGRGGLLVQVLGPQVWPKLGVLKHVHVAIFERGAGGQRTFANTLIRLNLARAGGSSPELPSSLIDDFSRGSMEGNLLRFIQATASLAQPTPPAYSTTFSSSLSQSTQTLPTPAPTSNPGQTCPKDALTGKALASCPVLPSAPNVGGEVCPKNSTLDLFDPSYCTCDRGCYTNDIKEPGAEACVCQGECPPGSVPEVNKGQVSCVNPCARLGGRPVIDNNQPFGVARDANGMMQCTCGEGRYFNGVQCAQIPRCAFHEYLTWPTPQKPECKLRCPSRQFRYDGKGGCWCPAGTYLTQSAPPVVRPICEPIPACPGPQPSASPSASPSVSPSASPSASPTSTASPGGGSGGISSCGETYSQGPLPALGGDADSNPFFPGDSANAAGNKVAAKNSGPLPIEENPGPEFASSGTGKKAKVILTWDPNDEAERVEGYHVYMRESTNEPPRRVATTPNIEVILPDLEYGKRYYFTVTAYNRWSEGPPSDEINFIPQKPEDTPSTDTPHGSALSKAIDKSYTMEIVVHGTPAWNALPSHARVGRRSVLVVKFTHMEEEVRSSLSLPPEAKVEFTAEISSDLKTWTPSPRQPEGNIQYNIIGGADQYFTRVSVNISITPARSTSGNNYTFDWTSLLPKLDQYGPELKGKLQVWHTGEKVWKDVKDITVGRKGTVENGTTTVGRTSVPRAGLGQNPTARIVLRFGG